MSFADIRDQEVAVRLLRNLILRNRIPNGLLFWGPGGVGKRSAALELAKAINCRQSKADACGRCLSCRKIAHGNHPDIKQLAPSGKTRLIAKKDIEEINEFAALRPFESEWRIFILHDAERMNLPAQNHFLKTLEEPPGRSLFILMSEYPRMLLPTIRSRCQLIRFRALRRETVSELLQNQRDLPDEVADSVAVLAEGQMSRALDLVDSEKRQVVFSLVERIAGGEDPVLLAEEFAAFLEGRRKQIEADLKAESAHAKLDEGNREEWDRLKEVRIAQQAAVVKRDLMDYLYLLETWYRDEMVVAATGDTSRVWNKDRDARLKARGSGDAPAKVAAIERTRYYLDRFVNEERVFRDLFFTLAEP
ncbi:MAG: hypothetical protein AMXMBFR4_07020 [Candidatus Hydrogenedentota bacterium]